MIISKTKLSFICQYAKFEKDLINGLEMAAKTKQRNNWTQKHIKTQILRILRTGVPFLCEGHHGLSTKPSTMEYN